MTSLLIASSFLFLSLVIYFVIYFFFQVSEEQLIGLLEQVSKATEKTTKVNVRMILPFLIEEDFSIVTNFSFFISSLIVDVLILIQIQIE